MKKRERKPDTNTQINNMLRDWWPKVDAPNDGVVIDQKPKWPNVTVCPSDQMPQEGQFLVYDDPRVGMRVAKDIDTGTLYNVDDGRRSGLPAFRADQLDLVTRPKVDVKPTTSPQLAPSLRQYPRAVSSPYFTNGGLRVGERSSAWLDSYDSRWRELSVNASLNLDQLAYQMQKVSNGMISMDEARRLLSSKRPDAVSVSNPVIAVEREPVTNEPQPTYRKMKLKRG